MKNFNSITKVNKIKNLLINNNKIDNNKVHH